MGRPQQTREPINASGPNTGENRASKKPPTSTAMPVGSWNKSFSFGYPAFPLPECWTFTCYFVWTVLICLMRRFYVEHYQLAKMPHTHQVDDLIRRIRTTHFWFNFDLCQLNRENRHQESCLHWRTIFY